MTLRAVTYQDFRGAAGPQNGGGDDVEAALARARGRARAEGFADGVAQTEARAEAQAAAWREALIAAVRGASDDLKAVEQRASERARAAALAFLASITRRLGAATLAPEIIEALDEALESAPSATIAIEVAPARLDELAALLADRPCDIRAAADLDDGQARVRWSGGHDRIDMTAAVARGLAAIEAHLAPTPTIMETDE